LRAKSQGRAWREEIPQASSVSLAFSLLPPSCARRIKLHLCLKNVVCALIKRVYYGARKRYERSAIEGFVRVWSRARHASETSGGGSGLASQLLTCFGPLLSAIRGW
jgi:hypothetical protein